MLLAVDRDPALLADAHPAERPAQFAADRAARHRHRIPAGDGDRGGHRAAVCNPHVLSIDLECDLFMHGVSLSR